MYEATSIAWTHRKNCPCQEFNRWQHKTPSNNTPMMGVSRPSFTALLKCVITRIKSGRITPRIVNVSALLHCGVVRARGSFKEKLSVRGAHIHASCDVGVNKTEKGWLFVHNYVTNNDAHVDLFPSKNQLWTFPNKFHYICAKEKTWK